MSLKWLGLAATPEEKDFRFGWHGDNGLGEIALQRILSGQKTASTCPAYDPVEARTGETLRLVDKAGKLRGRIRISRIELLRWDQFDEALAAKIGSSLEEIARMAQFANSRAILPDEEMRVTHFELI